MNWGFWVLNCAYVFYVASAAFKDMLRLRLVLFVATIFYIAYGFVETNWPFVYWNVGFGAVQLYQIWTLLRQRMGINLDEEAEAIRVLMFSGLDRPLFNVLWQAGQQNVYSDGETLIEYDEAVGQLMLILEGEVDVAPPNRPAESPIRLGRLRLLGEMSSVTGGTASATVTADGLVRTRNWRQVDLDKLGKDHPEIEKNALLLIGAELARKIT